jgi:hypothetical protein
VWLDANGVLQTSLGQRPSRICPEKTFVSANGAAHQRIKPKKAAPA